MFAVLSRLMEAWGQSLYRHLRALGLVDMGMEGYVGAWVGRSPGASLMCANCKQVQEEAVNAGFITNEEVDQVLTLLDDPDFAIRSDIIRESLYIQVSATRQRQDEVVDSKNRECAFSDN